MKRREFIKTGVISAGAIGLFGGSSGILAESDFRNQIMTVTGPVEAEKIGYFLPHEHVMSKFGADAAEPPVYDRDKLFRAVVPYLKSVKKLGCDVLADCTTAYFGRDPLLLKEISEMSGVKLLTNTGYYGAANDRYVPQHAYSETAGQLARRWIKEWRNGIGETGIRPGFVKIGVDDSPLSEVDAKLVRAGALTHLETGLVMAIHTSNNPQAAMQELNILKEEKVSGSAWIWVHANNVEDNNALLKAAERGAWLEFDGVREENIENHLEKIKLMKENGYLGQVLLSHDGNSFRANNRPAKAYDSLFREFIPALKNAGYSDEEIKKLTIRNPANAFKVDVRSV